MKRICIIALLAMVTLGTAVPRAHALGAFASWWNMDQENSDGFGFGIRQKIKLAPLFAIDTRASYINFNDADVNVYPLEATGLVSLGLFYGGVGVGYYIFDSSADGYSFDNNFGWYLSGGIEINAGPVGVFGEIKWTSLSADVKDVDPNLNNVPTSIDADGMGFLVGVMFGI